MFLKTKIEAIQNSIFAGFYLRVAFWASVQTKDVFIHLLDKI